MSVQDQIDRISNAKTDIANALGEKGVEVSEGTSIDEMGDLIRSIPVGEKNVIESISVNSVSLPIENKNVNIDLSGYAQLNLANTFKTAQTYSGTMPSTSTAVVSTVCIGKSVYVFGGKNANGGWADYSLLNAGQVNLIANTNNQIFLNAKATNPTVIVKDATNGQRNFTFGATGGTLATEEWVEAQSSNSGGGTKIYKHRIVQNGTTYNVFSLSNYNMAEGDGTGCLQHSGKLIGINIEGVFVPCVLGVCVSGTCLTAVQTDNMSFLPVMVTIDVAIATSYTIEEV